MQHGLLNQILPILSAVRDDKEKLERILAFLESEILPEVESKDDVIKIPEKYEALVSGIAQHISFGQICHLNMDTLELEDYPASIDIEEWEDMTGEEFAPKYLQWQNVLSFEPMDSSESFRIMEGFAGQLNNNKMQNTLLDILNRRKPFAHFNRYIHNSDYRDKWLAFKNAAYEKHVREIIYLKLHKQD
ncbi:MAG: hypothetical protein IT249_06200 [Chitinophagaceae bacterium]|nr:hypothetical protein [Chitinophagaceae bacterium]